MNELKPEGHWVGKAKGRYDFVLKYLSGNTNKKRIGKFTITKETTTSTPAIEMIDNVRKVSNPSKQE